MSSDAARSAEMPNPTVSLKDRLTRYRQIKISVIGRNSGRTTSISVLTHYYDVDLGESAFDFPSCIQPVHPRHGDSRREFIEKQVSFRLDSG
jgi:hypothetical protein